MGVVQIDHHGLDAAPERRAGLQPCGRSRHGAHAAAGAASAEQVHPGHDPAHWRQLDAVVDALRRLRLDREAGLAGGAGVQARLDQVVRDPGQGTRRPGTAAARRPVARERFGLWPRAGGVEELSGVLGGRVSSSTRFSRAATRANSARISASFSASLSLPGSNSGVMHTVSQAIPPASTVPQTSRAAAVRLPTQVSSYQREAFSFNYKENVNPK